MRLVLVALAGGGVAVPRRFGRAGRRRQPGRRPLGPGAHLAILFGEVGQGIRQRITKRGLSGAKRKTLLAVTPMNLPPNSHLGGKCYMWKLLKWNGGRDRTRTCDLLRVKHYLLVLFIDCTATYKPVFDVTDLQNSPERVLT